MSRKRDPYLQIYDGEWIEPVRRGFREQCCDCGLIHRVDFRIRNGRIEVRAARDHRATAAVRNAKKLTIKHKRKPADDRPHT